MGCVASLTIIAEGRLIQFTVLAQQGYTFCRSKTGQLDHELKGSDSG